MKAKTPSPLSLIKRAFKKNMPQIPPLKMLTSQWFNHCSCQRGNATGLGNDTPFNMPGAGQQNKYQKSPGRGSQQWVLLCLWAFRHHQTWAGVLDKGKQTTFFLCCLFTVERNFHCTIPKGMLRRTWWDVGVPVWGRQLLLERPVKRVPSRSNPSLGSALSKYLLG